MKDDLTPAIIDQADVLTQQIRQAQELAEIKNAAIRQAERQAQMDLWQDPEVMAHRHAMHIKQALESLWSIRNSGQAEPETPLPPDSELPKHMRGQQPSTVRAWLRGEPKWEAKIKEHRKTIANKNTRIAELQKRYPQLYGCDFSIPAKAVEGTTVASIRQPVPWLEKLKEKNDELVFNQKPRLIDRFASFWKSKP